MKNNKIKFLIGFLVLIITFYKIDAFAAEDGLFSVSPLDPETGQSMGGYYDMMLRPKEIKEIQLRVYNSSKKNILVNIELNNSSTNDNGITSYIHREDRDSTLQVAFSDISTTKDVQVDIPKNSFKDISVEITMPDKEFNGEILGGIRVTSAETEEIDEGEQTAVKGKIAYTVGVIIRNNENIIEPELVLNEVFADQRNYRNYISANLQNIKATIIRNLEVKSKIYKKDTTNIMYEAEGYDMRMAPNSNFNFGVSLEEQPLEAGLYTINISGMADEIPFEFEKDFEISEPNARRLNKNAVYVEEKSDNIYLYYIIGISILLILSIVVYSVKGVKK